MRKRVLLILILLAGIWLWLRAPRTPARPPSVRASAPLVPVALPPAQIHTVRVAAIQCCSEIGKIFDNRQRLTQLIEKAAEQNARIVVLPECAVQGYMNPADDIKWSARPDDAAGELPVAEAAESVPGSSTRHFGALAARLKLYLALPLIESADGKFHNTLVLLAPDGKIVAHHRKRSLWPPGDGTWATPGDGSAQVVATPYGRLGLMICHDVHELPSKLKAAKADIVLYAVGWYGPNTENWFRDIFPRRHVVPNNFAVVAANWCGKKDGPEWQGQGYSCVIARDGNVLAMAAHPDADEIVLADLPVGENTAPPEALPESE